MPCCVCESFVVPVFVGHGSLIASGSDQIDGRKAKPNLSGELNEICFYSCTCGSSPYSYRSLPAGDAHLAINRACTCAVTAFSRELIACKRLVGCTKLLIRYQDRSQLFLERAKELCIVLLRRKATNNNRKQYRVLKLNRPP